MARPALPPRRQLEYVLSDKEFGLQELVRTFDENDTAFTVVVTQPHTNNTLPYSGLEVNKTYRVQCVSRRERVLAYIDNHDGLPTYFSIPESYTVNMVKVDKQGRETGPRDTAHRILSQATPPVRARFVADNFTKIKGRAIFTSHIPPLTLVKIFHEVHILFNRIPNIVKYEEIDEDIVYVPMFYHKLRMKRVIGVTGLQHPEFMRWETKINRSSSCLEFDMMYGHLEMTKFWPHQYRREIDYSIMEPVCCAIFPDLFPKSQPSLPTQLYEPLSPVRNGDDDNTYSWIDEAKLVRQPSSDYTNDIPRGVAKPRQAQSLGSLVSKIPKGGKDTTSGLKPRQVQSSGNLVSKIPKEDKDTTSGLKPRQAQSSGSLVSTSTTSDLKLQGLQSGNVGKGQLPEVKTTEDIQKLTIDEVCGYMEQLKLDQYCPIFRDQLVDGLMLCDLDKALLTSEFGFKGFDAIKLLYFIKEGHVPK